MGDDGSPLIVVWQSGSFIDVRRFGVGMLKTAGARTRTGCGAEPRSVGPASSGVFEGPAVRCAPNLPSSAAWYRTMFMSIRQLSLSARIALCRCRLAGKGLARAAGWHFHFMHPCDADLRLPALQGDAAARLLPS